MHASSDSSAWAGFVPVTTSNSPLAQATGRNPAVSRHQTDSSLSTAPLGTGLATRPPRLSLHHVDGRSRCVSPPGAEHRHLVAQLDQLLG